MTKSLGLELSTQSATMIVLDWDEGVVYKKSFTYEDRKRLKNYGTEGGVLPSQKGERHTSPYLMVDALDECFEVMQEDGVDLSNVDAISMDGMQHCTIYSAPSLDEVLRISNNDIGKDGPSLVDIFQSKEAFTRETSPIWEDSTTGEEVAELTRILEPLGGIINLTGNKAEHRFPAAQYMKWIKEDGAFQMTKYLQILSAFGTSILAGRIAPVDTGDGWGSNLNTLDINSPSWDIRITSAIESHLGLPQNSLYDKLGQMTHYDAVVGRVNGYFARKFDVNPNAIVLAGKGDNPASLLGNGGAFFGSYGSSITLNGQQRKVSVSNGEDNVFGYTPLRSMSLVCFKNGGKLHEETLRAYLRIPKGQDITPKNWRTYESLAREAGFGDHLMLPYFLPEIVPSAPQGIILEDGLSDKEPGEYIAALYLSQVAAMRIHSKHMETPSEFAIVGGGGSSPTLRRLVANVFNASIYTTEDSEYAAAKGCALAAMRHAKGCSYQEVTDHFVQKVPGSMVTPDPAEVARLKPVVERYATLERAHMNKG